MRRTLKRKNKAGNRVLETKALMANMFDGKYRNISTKIFRNFAATKIQTDARKLIIKRNLAMLYNKLQSLQILLKQNTQITNNELIAARDEVIDIFPPDRTIDDFLRLPNLYEELKRVLQMINIRFPPENERRRTSLITQITSILKRMYKPLSGMRANIPPTLQRQNATYRTRLLAIEDGMGKKRKTRHANKKRN